MKPRDTRDDELLGYLDGILLDLEQTLASVSDERIKLRMHLRVLDVLFRSMYGDDWKSHSERLPF